MNEWSKFCDLLASKYGAPTVKRWVNTAEVTSFDAGNIYIQMSDSFQKLWFEEHVLPLAALHLKTGAGRFLKLHLLVEEESFSSKKNTSENEVSLVFSQDMVNLQATFDQFCSGIQNLVPFQILSSITEAPLDDQNSSHSVQLATYNPIYIHGPSGTGKTHLLMAAAQSFNMHGIKSFFVNAETFTKHVVTAIRSGKMDLFRKTYRHLDVLLIDDVEIFARKTATQEELFHTFNALHTDGKQIILTSSLPPRLLENIEERLISRFEWGITLPLITINEEEVIKDILQKRAGFYQINLSSNVKEYIATNFVTADKLCGAIDTLAIKSSLQKISTSNLELAHAERHLENLLQKNMSQAVTPDEILKVVSENFNVEKEDILGKSQSRECVTPRHIAMFLLRKELKMPFMKIGSIFSRDHSTVMSSIKNVEKHIGNQDPDISMYLTQVQRKLSDK